MTNEDILDLLSLMPRAVDLVWRRDSGPIQCDEAGETLPLDDMEAARAFLRDHGKEVACYRLDPREEGKLIVGMFNDGEAKTIAREELNIEVTEGLFGQSAPRPGPLV